MSSRRSRRLCTTRSRTRLRRSCEPSALPFLSDASSLQPQPCDADVIRKSENRTRLLLCPPAGTSRRRLMSTISMRPGRAPLAAPERCHSERQCQLLDDDPTASSVFRCYRETVQQQLCYIMPACVTASIWFRLMQAAGPHKDVAAGTHLSPDPCQSTVTIAIYPHRSSSCHCRGARGEVHL